MIGPLSLAFVGQVQVAFAPLVTGEQMTFGGAQIGRGYDPGAVSGDQGAGASLELRYDEHLPKLFVDTLQPYIYFDAGKVTNFHAPGSAQQVASTGMGVRFFLPYSITADVELSQTLHAVAGSDNGKKATKLLMDAAIRF